MSGTTINAALTALTAVFTAAEVSGLTVTDGPHWDASPPTPMLLEVGWSPDTVDAALSIRSSASAAGIGSLETLSAWCLLSSWTGSGTLNPVPAGRAAVSAVFATLVGVIEQDPSLGGAVSMARVSEIRYIPRRSEGGADVGLSFGVEMQAVLV